MISGRSPISDQWIEQRVLLELVRKGPFWLAGSFIRLTSLCQGINVSEPSPPLLQREVQLTYRSQEFFRLHVTELPSGLSSKSIRVHHVNQQARKESSEIRPPRGNYYLKCSPGPFDRNAFLAYFVRNVLMCKLS